MLVGCKLLAAETEDTWKFYMPKKSNLYEFIQKALQIHGTKYSYENSIYLGAKSKLEIICPTHGSFWQTPFAHVINENGCPQCGRIQSDINRQVNFEDWVIEANATHNFHYDYSKSNLYWQGIKSRVEIICPIHGSFLQSPYNHSKLGQGCPDCGIEGSRNNQPHQLTTFEFIERAERLFGKQCDYSKTEYKALKKKVTIICNLCNTEYEQLAFNHIISGFRGCPNCKIVPYNGGGSILRSDLNVMITLYFIHLRNNYEQFCKIGLTGRPIEKRFETIKKHYNIEILASKKLKYSDAINEEIKFKQTYIKYKYTPKISFWGYTECFQIELVSILFPGKDIV